MRELNNVIEAKDAGKRESEQTRLQRFVIWFRALFAKRRNRVLVSPSGIWATIRLTDWECRQIEHLVDVRESVDGLAELDHRESILRVYLIWEVPHLESVFRTR